MIPPTKQMVQKYAHFFKKMKATFSIVFKSGIITFSYLNWMFYAYFPVLSAEGLSVGRV